MRKEGYIGEEIAWRVLERADYVVLAQNFCVRGGEIDLIACAPNGAVVFVEVKLRACEPIDHRALVPWHKLSRLRRAASAWCAQQVLPVYGRRFDLLLIIRGRKVMWYKGIQ